MEPEGGLHATQELGLENAWISELIFTSLFVAFVLWTFSPFVFLKKRFYTTLLYSQLLSVLVGEASSLLPMRVLLFARHPAQSHTACSRHAPLIVTSVQAVVHSDAVLGKVA